MHCKQASGDIFDYSSGKKRKNRNEIFVSLVFIRHKSCFADCIISVS